MAIRLGIALGGTPIGAPIVGWVADHFGPRWSLGVAAASGIVAAAFGVRYLIVSRSAQQTVHGNASRDFGKRRSDPMIVRPRRTRVLKIVSTCLK